jgi:hypothetical protein
VTTALAGFLAGRCMANHSNGIAGLPIFIEMPLKYFMGELFLGGSPIPPRCIQPVHGVLPPVGEPAIHQGLHL